MSDQSATGQIKVSAHVLVQLGEELVTDAEQAILECVKNAYDADSPGCVITVSTTAQGTFTQEGTAAEFRKLGVFAENVQVSFTDETNNRIELDKNGELPAELENSRPINRHLHWTGSILIEDQGYGLSPDQIKSSWLVISRSSKRVSGGAKAKTQKGRTPLGDKGVGRLGTMKLGDILRVESAQQPDRPKSFAYFRWGDCEAAETIDEIPVTLGEEQNLERFKGTRVQVLGVKDLEQWAASKRSLTITRSLAALISPFESKSSFPVLVDIDGHKTSLVAVTDQLLTRAVAQFSFEWKHDDDGPLLQCVARFRERLFRPLRPTQKQREKIDNVFGKDDGDAFVASLTADKRLKQYSVKARPDRNTYVELKRSYRWADIRSELDGASKNPGELDAAFYYFNLQDNESETEQRGQAGLDVSAVSGFGIDKDTIKEMAGVSILRDGFRVRSPGDWLKISQGMTSGSTYNLRYHNTLGYFELSGEKNFGLVEKSDREGFVENAYYRGFMNIAETCKAFANESLEAVRRAQDRFSNEMIKAKMDSVPQTREESINVVDGSIQLATKAQSDAETVVDKLGAGLSAFQEMSFEGGVPDISKAVAFVADALRIAKQVQRNLDAGRNASIAVKVMRQEHAEDQERMFSLYEAAAVGLSARGLAHELRTHIVEIRKRASAIDTLVKNKRATPENTAAHIRAIRSSCSSIASAAALIDPLLPRSRAIKESMVLRDFVEEYFTNRSVTLEQDAIKYEVSPRSSTVSVRMNRARLLAVLDNLVRNSVYWLRRHGALDEDDRKIITVRISSDGFEVSDNGPGVDPKLEDNLFDMFVSGKPASERGGQGLGLFIITELLAADGCSLYLAQNRNRLDRRYQFNVDLSAVIQ